MNQKLKSIYFLGETKIIYDFKIRELTKYQGEGKNENKYFRRWLTRERKIEMRKKERMREK